VGEVRSTADGWAEVEVKNKFAVGDQIEVIHPSGNHIVTLEAMQNLNGESITIAPGSPLQVRIPLEARYAGALLARLLPT
jgi:putative protease